MSSIAEIKTMEDFFFFCPFFLSALNADRKVMTTNYFSEVHCTFSSTTALVLFPRTATALIQVF